MVEIKLTYEGDLHCSATHGPSGNTLVTDAPLDNNTSLVLKGDVLCTANLGFVHAKPEEADRTVVCMKGFSLPK